MPAGDFLYQLARVESAASTGEVLIDRIAIDSTARLSSGARAPIEIPLDLSRFEIADILRKRWRVAVDDAVLHAEEVGPAETNLAVRWRELHRGLSLTRMLTDHDPQARLTAVELDADAGLGRVSGFLDGRLVTTAVPLMEETDYSWDAIEMLIEQGTKARPEPGVGSPP